MACVVLTYYPGMLDHYVFMIQWLQNLLWFIFHDEPFDSFSRFPYQNIGKDQHVNMTNEVEAVAAPEFFFCGLGASRGKNFKKMLIMADFCIF